MFFFIKKMAANGLASRNILAKYPPKVPAGGRVKGVGGSSSLGLSLSIFAENGEGGPPKAPLRGQGRVGFSPPYYHAFSMKPSSALPEKPQNHPRPVACLAPTYSWNNIYPRPCAIHISKKREKFDIQKFITFKDVFWYLNFYNILPPN